MFAIVMLRRGCTCKLKQNLDAIQLITFYFVPDLVEVFTASRMDGWRGVWRCSQVHRLSKMVASGKTGEVTIFDSEYQVHICIYI